MNAAFDVIELTKLRQDSNFASLDGSGFSVVVIDTGLNSTHSLLADNYITGFDFLTETEEIFDEDGHGTHVAGIIGAKDPEIGIAPEVGIIGLRVFAENGNGSNLKIDEALEWVLANQEEYNIIAVNISSGSGFYTPSSEITNDPLQEQIEEVEEAGITVVAAAGNNYQDNQEPNIALPGIYSTVAVGATWPNDQKRTINWVGGTIDFSTDTDRIVSFSQRSDAANMIFAPGAVIKSTIPEDRTGIKSGTSMATPMVTGTVVLMQQAALEFGDRLLKPDEIADILQDTADTIFDGDDEDDNVDNTQLEYRRLNTYAAVSRVKEKLEQEFLGSDDADLIEGTRGDDKILTLRGNDTLKGSHGNDTLIGSGGNDRLFGSYGYDILTGGRGSDRFIIASPQQQRDRLRDFNPDQDLIVVYANQFQLDIPSKQSLPEEYFSLGSQATNSQQRFLYEANSGELRFDADGSDSQFSPVTIARLQGEPEFNHFHLFVV